MLSTEISSHLAKPSLEYQFVNIHKYHYTWNTNLSTYLIIIRQEQICTYKYRYKEVFYLNIYEYIQNYIISTGIPICLHTWNEYNQNGIPICLHTWSLIEGSLLYVFVHTETNSYFT